MSSCIPTRAVVPWVGHINAVVAVPEFVVNSIVFANVICSSKAEKSITLQLCWFTNSPHMRCQHHRRSEKHHTPSKADGHFWSGLNVQYKVSLIKVNYPKRPSCFLLTSVWVMWAQMSSPEASSEPEGFLAWSKITSIFSKLFHTILLIVLWKDDKRTSHGGWAASHALILAPVAHPAAVRVGSHVAPGCCGWSFEELQIH